jgi:hypothetical protein
MKPNLTDTQLDEIAEKACAAAYEVNLEASLKRPGLLSLCDMDEDRKARRALVQTAIELALEILEKDKQPTAPPITPPEGYHMATDEELDCLPPGSIGWWQFDEMWVESSRVGGRCEGTILYACPNKPTPHELFMKEVNANPITSVIFATLGEQAKQYAFEEWQRRRESAHPAST